MYSPHMVAQILTEWQGKGSSRKPDKDNYSFYVGYSFWNLLSNSKCQSVIPEREIIYKEINLYIVNVCMYQNYMHHLKAILISIM